MRYSYTRPPLLSPPLPLPSFSLPLPLSPISSPSPTPTHASMMDTVIRLYLLAFIQP